MNEDYFQFFSIVFFSTIIITYLYRLIAIKLGFVAIPNLRSSHKKPIPTGGGIVISFVYIISFIYLLFFLEQTTKEIFQVAVGLAMGGIAITIVGFIDDIFNTKAFTKLIIQIILSIWIIFIFLGNLDNILSLTSNLYYWPLMLAAIFLLVWLINVFNFMDAIGWDGSIRLNNDSLVCSIDYFLHPR